MIVRADDVKCSDQPHVVPLRIGLAKAIEAVVKETEPGRPVFRVPATAARMLKTDLVGAGLPLVDIHGHKRVFHSFRHTAATWMASEGLPWTAIQGVTGHKSLAVLMAPYAHLSKGGAR